jgi:hypothetical protein
VGEGAIRAVPTKSKCRCKAGGGLDSLSPPLRETNASFDHLVGAGEQRRRQFEAKRFGSLRCNRMSFGNGAVSITTG